MYVWVLFVSATVLYFVDVSQKEVTNNENYYLYVYIYFSDLQYLQLLAPWQILNQNGKDQYYKNEAR